MSLRTQAESDLKVLTELFEHPGWKLLERDFEQLRTYGISNADKLYKTNDEWQAWRGQKGAYDFLLAYPLMTEHRLATLVDESFDDEAEQPGNELED